MSEFIMNLPICNINFDLIFKFIFRSFHIDQFAQMEKNTKLMKEQEEKQKLLDAEEAARSGIGERSVSAY
mgnify:CR=1 FL=1